jgi:hypothetical protein
VQRHFIIVRRRRLATGATALRAPRRRGAALVLRLLDERNPELNKARAISGRRGSSAFSTARASRGHE